MKHTIAPGTLPEGKQVLFTTSQLNTDNNRRKERAALVRKGNVVLIMASR